MTAKTRNALLALAMLAAASCAAARVPTAPPPAPPPVAAACRAVDGDTIVCDRVRVRILNIDAPELGAHARCAAEAELADRALRFTAQSLARGPVEIRVDLRRPRDRYGRTLAWVTVGGQDLGEALIAAGLARRWDGRRHPWCP